MTLVLLVLNMRGMKEPLKLLLPVFLGFLITHGGLIVYGILAHAEGLSTLIPETVSETHELADSIGWFALLSLLLRAFALGGGTYTGIEAVSNNINNLKEPRVETGRLTMLYMAASLAFTAGGLIVLYLLWDAMPQEGMTLNAVTFKMIYGQLFGEDSAIQSAALILTLLFAAGILFVAANTGFLGGPAVLANMAIDRWVPHQFSQLSSRLVTQNGLLLMGGGALGILLITGGEVDVLVVLYSVNVFLTFSLSLYGLCLHWWQCRHIKPHAWRRLALSLVGFVVCAGILSTTLFEKFTHGAWLTVLITGFVVATGLAIHRHYESVQRALAKIDALFATAVPPVDPDEAPKLDPAAPTAVFLVGRSLGAGMHTLLSAIRLFPGDFHNFLFLSVGEIDAESFHGEAMLPELTREMEEQLRHYVWYCQRHGFAAAFLYDFGTDTVQRIVDLADTVDPRISQQRVLRVEPGLRAGQCLHPHAAQQDRLCRAAQSSPARRHGGHPADEDLMNPRTRQDHGEHVMARLGRAIRAFFTIATRGKSWVPAAARSGPEGRGMTNRNERTSALLSRAPAL